MHSREPITDLREVAEVAELQARISACTSEKILRELDAHLVAAKARELRGLSPMFPPLLVPARCR
jgi:hypothetical protein